MAEDVLHPKGPQEILQQYKTSVALIVTKNEQNELEVGPLLHYPEGSATEKTSVIGFKVMNVSLPTSKLQQGTIVQVKGKSGGFEYYQFDPDEVLHNNVRLKLQEPTMKNSNLRVLVDSNRSFACFTPVVPAKIDSVIKAAQRQDRLITV